MTKTITKNKSFDISQLQNIAEVILAEAKKLGADQAEVTIEANKGFSVSARQADVETIEYHQDKAIDITVYVDHKSGASSLSSIEPEAIKAAVKAACHIASFADSDPAAGIADKAEISLNYPSLNTFFPWGISVQEAIQLACECERQALSFDKRITVVEDAQVGTGEIFKLYANSNQFLGSYLSTQHELSCVVVAKDDAGMQRDYSYTVAVDPSLLETAEKVGRDAAKAVIERLGAQRLSTRKAPVIFLAEESRGLIGHFIASIFGGRLYRKASFLLDHLDKQIFPDFMHIQEHPHLDKGLGTTPFDEDGILTRNNVFIDQGILTNYALDVYSARKLNMKTTGNAGGIHNLVVKTSEQNLSQLLKTMDTGLLVTEVMGQGINLLTGDYSRGATGFWVEKGVIKFPVHEITIAGTLQEMYRNIVAIGNDIDKRGNVLTGSILIEEMTIAGL